MNHWGRSIFNYLLEKPLGGNNKNWYNKDRYIDLLLKYDCSIYSESNYSNAIESVTYQLMTYVNNKFKDRQKSDEMFNRLVNHGILRCIDRSPLIQKYVFRYKSQVYDKYIKQAEEYYKELLEVKNFNDTMIEFHPDGIKAKEILNNIKKNK